MPDLDERRALCEAEVTLDGKPATIRGAQKAFAFVSQRDTGLGAQWAWPTVADIVANRGGAFHS